MSADDPAVRRFRTDERIVGTLVLAALAEEAETLRALTARRLAALNYGTIIILFFTAVSVSNEFIQS